jgi:hypothetical protein
MGGGRPPKDSVSADAKRLASANENGTFASTGNNDTNGGVQVPPEMQSAMDKEKNFQQAAEVVGTKVANDPGSVTKEDASYLESRERRAHGDIEKGGAAATARSLADKNEQQ